MRFRLGITRNDDEGEARGTCCRLGRATHIGNRADEMKRAEILYVRDLS
jgi:hypothetical protein